MGVTCSKSSTGSRGALATSDLKVAIDQSKKIGQPAEESVDVTDTTLQIISQKTPSYASQSGLSMYVPTNTSPDLAVFSWLTWAPAPGTKCFETLHRCFPGALPGTAMVRRTASALSSIGITPENAIYGQSICPDEINNEKGDLATMMVEHFGSCFPMGGIGGAPFCGKTGFMAFSHHVPDDGHVVVLFGPHIAISDEGELGKYLRDGQSKHSTACGAVLAAYNACQDCDFDDNGEYDKHDMQQSWLKGKVNDNIEKINSAPEPIATLMLTAYEAVKQEMLVIVNTKFGNGKLVLIGGVQINMPQPCEDHFLPLLFRTYSETTVGAAPSTTNGTDLLTLLRYSTPDIPKPIPQLHQVVDEDSCLDVFSWLTWAPARGTKCFETLHRCFPGALPGTAMVRRTASALSSIGITPENAIYGQSICPDEINNEKGDLATMMVEHFGSCFPMGGIGGAPFCGKTGFMAFSHHVPDDGHVVVLFGPHIAISDEGELGKYLRDGQSKHSTACGAVLAAYNACQDCDFDDNGEYDKHDMQQSWLKGKVNDNIEKINSAPEPIATLMLTAYEAVKQEMLVIVNTKFGNGKLVLIGGVQINMPQPCEDHFLPLMLQVSSETGKSVDLLPNILLRGPSAMEHLVA